MLQTVPTPTARKDPSRATLPEIRDYFGMTSAQVTRDWKTLNEGEKEFFYLSVAQAVDHAGPYAD